MDGPAEVKIQVTRHDCKVMEIIGDEKVLVSKIIVRDKFSDHLINGQLTPILEQKLKSSGIRTIKLPEKGIWVRTQSCSACSFLGSSDAIIISAAPISRTEMSYRLLVPPLGYLRQIIKGLGDLGLQPKILEIKRLFPPNRKSEDELTERQLQLLILAYKKGYFDAERKTSLTELAKTLDISPSSAQELLKRALKKVVRAYLKHFEENP
ncbi:MAG TPA: helix-turn-helix domain-containing protein [Geobacterales bacterium]|nr:helix-turn-helix domain-containing protein [Geobacterales bacterium]